MQHPLPFPSRNHGVWLLALALGGCVGEPAGGDSDDSEDLGVAGSAVLPAHTARAVATGIGHTCALLDNSQIKCWGGNWSGQLGYGDTASRGDNANEMGNALAYVDLGGQYSATAVVAGDYHTCALLDDGKVKCWGENGFGQLGLGDTASRGDQAAEMGDNLPVVSLGTGRTAKALAAGGLHTCALLDNNTVKCWGKNTYGQLGLGDNLHRGDGANEMGDNLPAVSLGTGRTAKSIYAAWGHTCALLDNNTVKCWGGNGYGQLGLGDGAARGDNANEMGDNLPAVSLGTGRTAKTLGLGYLHTCAVLDNNTVKCWGGNSDGQLGLGDMTNRGDNANEMGDNLPAVSLGTGRTAKAVGGGEYHSCARLDNDTVKCWGKSNLGQLGLGDTTSRGDGTNEMGDNLAAVALGAGRTAQSLSSRSYDTCVTLDNAQVKCWGTGWYGVLGQGDTATRGDGANEMGDNLPVVSLGDGLLLSNFFKVNPRAIKLMQGQDYNMNDPAWLTGGSNQNKDVFAYKVFAGLHMLGYNTQMGDYIGASDPHLRVLHAFQSQYGFTVEDTLRSAVLGKLDELVAQREPTLATRGSAFLLYNHMQPLARNDASRDHVAMVNGYPFSKLPGWLQMGLYESVQCIAGQCVGSIQDAQGNDWPTFPVDINQDYRFVGAYYGPTFFSSRWFSAAVNVQTVLHEFGHYIDGSAYSPSATYPVRGAVSTAGFYAIGFDMSGYHNGCAPRLSQDIQDWLSKYGYNPGYGNCNAGEATIHEDWAESFAFYVTAGVRFRAAAAQKASIAAKYQWIKTNVFAGVEFNTDLQAAGHSGCNDAPGLGAQTPGYISCSESAVWDGELPTL